MQIYTGGFPAAFGDRSSGVVDLASLRPDEPRYHEVALSFFNASLLSAGRFGADAANEWVASVRRSKIDFLYDAFSDRPERPRYRDAFAKARFEIDDRLAVTLNVLHFRDDIELHDDLDIEEVARSVDEDRYGWLRLDHSFDDALHGTTLIARTRLDATRAGVTGKEGLATGTLADDRSFAIDSVQSEWSWRKSDVLTLEFGGTAAKLRGQYDYRDAVEFGLLFDLPGAPQAAQRERSTALVASGRQYAIYGSARLRAGPRVTADLGVRWDEQTLDPEGGTASPRLGLRYELGPSALLRLSLGRFYQSHAVNELRVADGELSFDAPQRSDHFVLGFERQFQRALSLRLELYGKDMSALRPRFENLANGLTLLPELKPDRIEIDADSAVARGLELSLASARDRNLSWSASYAWAEAEDRVAGIVTRRAWDQTHTVHGAVAWRVHGWDFNLATVLRTGWPTTRLTLTGVRDGVPIVATARRNAERVGRYRSTDFRAARELKLGRAKVAAFAEIGNLFDHVNRCCTEYEIETDDDDETVLELSPIRYLPRVVSLGFIASF
jgi:outer membrane receptor protein involved in Fe transport